jgi:hypothetical protein
MLTCANTGRILYSSAVTQLLRPLLDSPNFPSAVVEEVIWTSAQQGLFLMDEYYRAQYTCRYQPVLQMFAVLHLCDVVARFFPGKVDGPSMSGPDAVQFGLEILMQSQASFPVAGPLQELLRRTSERSVRLPRNVRELTSGPCPPNTVYQMDDFIDACTRPTYIQPASDIHLKYTPTFSADWDLEGPLYGFIAPPPGERRLRAVSDEERGGRRLMEVRDLLNIN